MTPEDCSSSTSSRNLKVTLLTSQWGSSKGGLSTINRELVTQLAKHDKVEVCMYLPWFSDEDKKGAVDCRVSLLKAKERARFNDPIDWLPFIPRDQQMDVVIGHGIYLDRQVPLIKEMRPECKWVQVVHTDPEEFGMFKTYPDPTPKGEKKHEAEGQFVSRSRSSCGCWPQINPSLALEALSAGLFVLVSGNSGLGEALEEVPFGRNAVVKS